MAKRKVPKRTVRGNPQGRGTIVKGTVPPVDGDRQAETGPERARRLRELTRPRTPRERQVEAFLARPPELTGSNVNGQYAVGSVELKRLYINGQRVV